MILKKKDDWYLKKKKIINYKIKRCKKNFKKVLTFFYKSSILNKSKGNGRIAQLGEHLPYKEEVIGSIPIATTKKIFDYIQLYQSRVFAWSLSSAGRASPLQGGGHRFDPYSDHQSKYHV